MKHARAVMLTEQFDAFGEVMPGADRSRREAPIAESGIIGRIGRGVFWLLIVAIVAARIACYPATPAFEVGSVTGPDHALAR